MQLKTLNNYLKISYAFYRENLIKNALTTIPVFFEPEIKRNSNIFYVLKLEIKKKLISL